MSTFPNSGNPNGLWFSNQSFALLVRWIFTPYLIFVAIVSLQSGAMQARAMDLWINGDWLINYGGGFVRRGLPGALALFLHHATAISLWKIIFGLQATVLLVFLGAVFKLTKGIRWSYLMAAELLSPATMSFTVLDRLDAGLRKDLLLFAALAIVILVLSFGRWKDWKVSVLLGALLVGLALSHEGLLVAIPYFFAAVAIEARSVRRAILICAIPFTVAAVALLAAVLHPGNQAVAQAICSAAGGTLGFTKPDLFHPTGGFCGGAISWMQLDVMQERAIIAPLIRQWHLPGLFSLLAIPTFLPPIALMYFFFCRDQLRYEVLTVLGSALISLAGAAVLFYVGLDWGRWVHMQAICLMLLTLMLDRKAALTEGTTRPSKSRGVGFGATAALALFLYATTWTLPGVGRKGETHGYASIVCKFYRTSLNHLASSPRGSRWR